MLGTIFFSLLGGHAGTVADRQAGALRARLAAVSVTPATQGQIIDGYRPCLRDQFRSDDPDSTAPSCAALRSQVSDPAAGTLLARSSAEAVRDDFTDTIQWLCLVTAGILVATFGLTFLLPRTARPDEI